VVEIIELIGIITFLNAPKIFNKKKIVNQMKRTKVIEFKKKLMIERPVAIMSREKREII